MVANRSKQKGDRGERKVVHKGLEYGLESQRVPVSGGAGGMFSGDVWIEGRRVEVKVRANGFATIEKWKADNDVLVLIRDRGTPVAVVDLDLLLSLMRDEKTLRIISERASLATEEDSAA